MIVIYCECCGVLLKVAHLDATMMCGACLEGKKPQRKTGHDSAMIHYAAFFARTRRRAASA